MKIVIRAFVVVLALTGAVATTHASESTSSANAIAISKTSAMPVPTCPPNDPNGCGIFDGN